MGRSTDLRRRLGQSRSQQHRRPGRRLPRGPGERGVLRLLHERRRGQRQDPGLRLLRARRRLHRPPVRRPADRLAARDGRPRVLPRDPVRGRRLRGHLVHGGLGDVGRGRGLRRDQRQLPIPQHQLDHPPTDRPGLRRLGLSLRLVHLLHVRLARRGNDVVRRFWDGAVGAPRSAPAIRSVGGPTAWPAFLATFDSWNTLPLHSYQERGGYPAPAWWHRRTLAVATRAPGLKSVRIPHLGSSAVLATPAAPCPRKRLLVNIDAPSTWGSRRCSSAATATAGSRTR